MSQCLLKAFTDVEQFPRFLKLSTCLKVPKRVLSVLRSLRMSHRCFKMSHSGLRCLEMFGGVSRCLKVFTRCLKYVSRCLNAIQGA